MAISLSTLRSATRSKVRKGLYGPPNYFVTKFTAEDRRMFGFWVLVFSIITLPVLGRYVFYVSSLSVLALVPNYTSETPVETEEDVNPDTPEK
jgi:hypothetical protein